MTLALRYPGRGDAYTRECLALAPDTSLSSVWVARELTSTMGSAPDGQRQWHRTDLVGDTAQVAGPAGRMGLHRARQAVAERLQRERHRSPALRAPQRGIVHLACLCPVSGGWVAALLRHRQTTRGTGREAARRDQRSTRLGGGPPRKTLASHQKTSRRGVALPLARNNQGSMCGRRPWS